MTVIRSLHVHYSGKEMIYCLLSSHCTGFIPEEVGTEGQGYIWRPAADSDDEREQVQDIWGEKSYRHPK